MGRAGICSGVLGGLLAILLASVAFAAAAKPDLATTKISSPPGTVAPGGSFNVSARVKNLGKGTAKASLLRFYLSRNRTRDGADLRLAGSERVAKLKRKKAKGGNARLTVPSQAAGLYHLLACADDTKKVKEKSDRNNCRAAAKQVRVTLPLLLPPPPDTTAPGAPVLTGIAGGSPGNDPSPTVSGTAETGSTVRFYTGADCLGAVSATGSVGSGGSFAVEVPVPENSTTTISAAATDAAGNTSGCSNGLGYTHDGVAPAAPTISSSNPPSGGNANNPVLIGSAEAGSTVTLHAAAACGGTPVASGSAASFASPGLAATVPNNSTTTFTATATDDAGNVSPCSSGFSYVEDSIVLEVEPNDTRAQANGGPLIDTDLTIQASLNPEGDADVFRIARTEPFGVILETATPSGPCDVNVDTELILQNAAGVEIASNDDISGSNRCSRIVSPTLSPGASYYALVLEGGNDASIASYRLDANFVPGALIQSASPEGPAKDTAPELIGAATTGSTVSIFDNPTCSGPVLGSGSAATFASSGITTSVPAETISKLYARATKDGETGPCSPAFSYIEGLAINEVEPNNTNPDADAHASGSGVVATGDTRFLGSIGTVGDMDRFRVELPPDGDSGILRIESFQSSGVDCAESHIDMVRIFDAGGTELFANGGFGIGGCSAIVTPSMEPGTYYVSNEKLGNNAILPPYQLEVNFMPIVAGDPAGNDTPAQATPFPSSDGVAAGDHTVEEDLDVWAITVPAGRSVRAETHQLLTNTTSCSDIKSRLRLYGPDGTTVLTTDTAGGRLSCSLIDGTGASPSHPAAHDLPGGTYFVEVGEPLGSATPVFQYGLAITIR